MRPNSQLSARRKRGNLYPIASLRADNEGRSCNRGSVFVAATAPFMNIVFDENDKLNTTLEQVNSNTYDRLRICRTTMRPMVVSKPWKIWRSFSAIREPFSTQE